MALYQYTCIDCDKDIEVRRPIHEPEEAVACPDCGSLLQRVYSFSYSMPGLRTEESWNRWYEGKEAGPGMSRERTMQLARKLYRDTKAIGPVAAKRTVSTPGHPATRADNRTD